jgi:CHAD domain-containing protein
MTLSKNATYPAGAISRHLSRMEKELSEISASSGPVEAVHQARVASRRLRNSFRLYKKLLPGRLVKEFRRVIVKNARLLGKARDIDIQIFTLAKIKERGLAPEGKVLLSKMITLLEKQRSRCSPSVFKSSSRILSSGFPDALRAALCSMDPLSEESARALSSAKIRDLLGSFLASFKEIKRRSDVAGLHSLRIRAKELRYSLEEFDALYTGTLLPFAAAAKQVQDILGDVHDMDVWIRSFPRLARKTACPRKESQVSLFEELFRDMRKKSYARFLSVWKRTWGNGLGKDLKRKISL